MPTQETFRPKNQYNRLFSQTTWLSESGRATDEKILYCLHAYAAANNDTVVACIVETAIKRYFANDATLKLKFMQYPAIHTSYS